MSPDPTDATCPPPRELALALGAEPGLAGVDARHRPWRWYGTAWQPPPPDDACFSRRDCMWRIWLGADLWREAIIGPGALVRRTGELCVVSDLIEDDDDRHGPLLVCRGWLTHATPVTVPLSSVELVFDAPQ
jgi:hypothetical protein